MELREPTPGLHRWTAPHRESKPGDHRNRKRLPRDLAPLFELPLSGGARRARGRTVLRWSPPLAAALAAAREHGLPTGEPRVLRDLTNLLVQLGAGTP